MAQSFLTFSNIKFFIFVEWERREGMFFGTSTHVILLSHFAIL